jgi:predicted DCC family thiol-disulfide oxidoreductase YuxK
VVGSAQSRFPDPVLLFDGECGLCQRVVRVLLRLDRAGRLRFAPLQGVEAQSFLRARGLPTESFDTLVFVTDWAHRETAAFRLRTAGVVAALRVCGGVAALAATVLGWIPEGWRDAAYRFVARTRARWFGTCEARPVTGGRWASRFLPD